MKCSKKRCKVCKNVQNPDIFQSSVTFERFKINHQLSCGDKGLAYLLHVKHAKTVYWRNHRSVQIKME